MPNPNDANDTILALDVGTKRIGVARAHTIARLPEPLTTIEADSHVLERLRDLVSRERAQAVVVGLPRDLKGNETAQTKLTQTFVEELKVYVPVPIYLQDEAVTSVKAKAELALAKPNYTKGEVDALAAMYILEDFLQSGAW